MHTVQDPDQPSAGLRERKKAETRRRLVSAALELALRDGADAVTVEEIARRADVSVRTFFNYFASKDEVLVGIDRTSHERIREAILARPKSESPARALQAALTPGDDEEMARLWRLRVQLVRQSPHLRPHHLAALHEFARTAGEALADRAGRPPGDPEALILAAAVIGSLTAVVYELADSPESAFSDAVTDVFAALRKAF